MSLDLQLPKAPALEGANNPTTTKSPLHGGLEMEAGEEKELGVTNIQELHWWVEFIARVLESWAKPSNNSETPKSKASDRGILVKGFQPFPESFSLPVSRGLFKSRTQTDRERLTRLPGPQDSDGILSVCQVSSSK